MAVVIELKVAASLVPSAETEVTMTTVLLGRLTYQCDIVGTSNESWRFRNLA